MIKKIMTALIAAGILVLAVAAYLIVTFDANHYRPMIEAKASELTGFPVQLGGVSLTWKKGLALEVRELALKIRETDTSPPPVTVARGYVALELMPLLRGTLQMGAIRVENPEVRVIRSPDGRLRGAAELAEVQPSQKPQSPSNAESTLALLIQNLTIQDGQFIFEDQTEAAVREYRVDQIELNLKNVSLLSPFPVELKAALFSGRQNVVITGKVQARMAQQEVRLSGFKLETKLEDLDLRRLEKSFPDVAESGLKEIGGSIQALLDDLVLSQKANPAVNAQVTLSRGGVVLNGLEPVENIELDMQVSSTGLTLKSLSADWSGSHVASSAKTDWQNAPQIQGSFQAALSGLDLAKAVPPPANPKDPSIQGMLSAGFQGTFSGADEASLTRGLKANGQVLIKNGIITNLNVLKEVLSKLSIIPGVSQKIQERLSEEYLAKLEERDTRLEDLNLPLRITDGILFADSIIVKSETFQISGRAQGAFQGPLSGRLYAAVDSEFSAALMRSVRELEYIADQSGQITIPLTIRGTLESPEVIPEVQQLASRLAMAKTQEVISGLLTKKKPADSAPVEDQTTDTQSTELAATDSRTQSKQSTVSEDPFAALLGQVLQAAAQKNK